MSDLSKHALKRAKGRCISPAQIEWLCAYGTSYPVGDGAEKLVLDKLARRKLASHLGPPIYSRVEESLNAYVVRSADGRIITCGWLTERVIR